MLHNTYRVISFDLDDTLWPVWPVIERAERLLHEWLTERHPEVGELGPKALADYRDQVVRDWPERRFDFTFLRKEAIRKMLTETGCDVATTEEAFAVFFRHRNEVTCYDDVLPVLATLREKYTLVALSNGNANVEITELRGIFHLTFNAAQVGRPKPSPRMFHRALEKSSAQPHQMLHVGDDPENDMSGARSAGIACAWINRDGRAWPAHLPPPDFELRDLHELLPVTGHK